MRQQLGEQRESESKKGLNWLPAPSSTQQRRGMESPLLEVFRRGLNKALPDGLRGAAEDA